MCPAEITLQQNVVDPTCIVTFRKTHIGHDLNSEEDIDHLCLRKKRKSYPRRKITDIETSRVNGAIDTTPMITIDLRPHQKNDDVNIDPSMLVTTDLHPHQNDSSDCNYPSLNDDVGNIEAFVNQHSDAVLYYKRPHESPDERFPFLQDDNMILVFVSPDQKSLLQKHGDGVVAVVWTYGTNLSFRLHMVVVLDQDNEAVPVAYAISDRSDFGLFDTFVSCIKEQVGALQPNTLITDLQESYYNHWKTVMGVPGCHLYCTWHVREACRNNIKKISHGCKQEMIRKTLPGLIAETDAAAFDRKLKELLGNDDDNVSEFLEYFRAEFVDCAPRWAYCHWPHGGLHMNAHLEAIHRSLKHLYNRCRRTKNSYAGLSTIVEFLRTRLKWAAVKSCNRVNFKLKQLNRAHERYVAFSSETQNRIRIKEVEDGCLIQPFKVSEDENVEKMYKVRRLRQSCSLSGSDGVYCDLLCSECQVCAHMYSCTCIDSAIRNIMCKHIHAVASVLRKKSKKLASACKEPILGKNHFTPEFPFVGIQTDEDFGAVEFESRGSRFLDDVKECREKVFKKLSDIMTFVTAADQPDQLKVVETLLEPTTSAVSNMTASLPMEDHSNSPTCQVSIEEHIVVVTKNPHMCQIMRLYFIA